MAHINLTISVKSAILANYTQTLLNQLRVLLMQVSKLEAVLGRRIDLPKQSEGFEVMCDLLDSGTLACSSLHKSNMQNASLLAILSKLMMALLLIAQRIEDFRPTIRQRTLHFIDSVFKSSPQADRNLL